MSQEPASANNLRLLDDETKAGLLALAREMRADVRLMGDVIAEEVLFKERLLASTVTKLLEAASNPNLTIDEAVKIVTVAAKLNDSWHTSVAPIARRLGDEIRKMRKELEVKSGPKVLAGPAGRLGDGGGRGRRRGSKGEAGVEADGLSARSPRSLVERPLVVPDGDGPGYGRTDHQDGGSEGQTEPD